MNLAPRIFVFFLSMLCALASCSSDGPLAGSASGRSFDRGTAVASVPGLAKQLGAPFLRQLLPDSLAVTLAQHDPVFISGAVLRREVMPLISGFSKITSHEEGMS